MHPNKIWQSLIKDHLNTAQFPLIVLLGPTASGKTQFSIELSHYCKDVLGTSTAVINADSRQLFRGMDIGTAKVKQSEMQGVPHYLFDALDPNEKATCAWYKQQAERVIDTLHTKGVVPILVGGSMLYIASITDGLSFDEEIRTELRSSNADCRFDVLILGFGKEREKVVVNINNRTSQLFANGWIQEVQQLLDAGFSRDDPGMKACGYREIIEYLQDGSDLTTLQESIAAKTRQYARRQMTWWKGDTRIHWL